MIVTYLKREKKNVTITHITRYFNFLNSGASASYNSIQSLILPTQYAKLSNSSKYLTIIDNQDQCLRNLYNPRRNKTLMQSTASSNIFLLKQSWCLWNHLCLKTMTIAVQLSLQCRSRTASFTRRRHTAVTCNPSC
jgi:hypothetical protein